MVFVLKPMWFTLLITALTCIAIQSINKFVLQVDHLQKQPYRPISSSLGKPIQIFLNITKPAIASPGLGLKVGWAFWAFLQCFPAQKLDEMTKKHEKISI